MLSAEPLPPPRRADTPSGATGQQQHHDRGRLQHPHAHAASAARARAAASRSACGGGRRARRRPQPGRRRAGVRRRRGPAPASATAASRPGTRRQRSPGRHGTGRSRPGAAARPAPRRGRAGRRPGRRGSRRLVRCASGRVRVRHCRSPPSPVPRPGGGTSVRTARVPAARQRSRGSRRARPRAQRLFTVPVGHSSTCAASCDRPAVHVDEHEGGALLDGQRCASAASTPGRCGWPRWRRGAPAGPRARAAGRRAGPPAGGPGPGRR